MSVYNTLVVQSTLTWILWPYRGRGGAESLPLLRGPLAESDKAGSLLPTLATLPEPLPAARTLVEKETKQNPWVLGSLMSLPWPSFPRLFLENSCV